MKYTKKQMLAIVLRMVGKHLVRRWYVYATFLIILTAPFPVILAVAVGWLGYFTYRLLTQPKEKDTL